VLLLSLCLCFLKATATVIYNNETFLTDWDGASICGNSTGNVTSGDCDEDEASDDDGEELTRSPNLLFIVLDQLRFDGLQHVQEKLKGYNTKERIRTPNIDKLMLSGTSFETAYCSSPSCGPARKYTHEFSGLVTPLKSFSSHFLRLELLFMTNAGASLLTGNTLRRTGIEGNTALKAGMLQKLGKEYVDKVEAMETFEQVLVGKAGYKAACFGKW